MDKVTNLKVTSLDYEDLFKEYNLTKHYKCVNKFNIVRLKINNTDRVFVNTLRRIMISMLPAKRFECHNTPQIHNGVINYIIPAEIKFRIETIQLSHDIDPNLVFEIKYKNNTFTPATVSTEHFVCTSNPKIKLSDYVNYIDNILTLQPSGYIKMDNIRIVENNASSNARFCVVSSCGFSCEELGPDSLEATLPEQGRTYNMVFRYCEKYDVKEIFRQVSEILIEKLNMIPENTIDYEDRFEITFGELYTISNIIYENILEYHKDIIIKQIIGDEVRISTLKIYDLENKKIINEIISKMITRIKAFVSQFS